MKKLSAICAALFITAGVMAQAPNKMSYQAVIRNNSNALVSNQSVGMRISIVQGSIFGASVYVETHTPTTNANGLVSIEIGNGTVVFGNLSTINWSNGPYFIKTETDPNAGTNYSITGTSQLLSVPYALYAATAGNNLPGPKGDTGPAGPQGPAGANGILPNGSAVGNTPYWNGSNWVTNSSTLFNNGSRVGIGTINPASRFHIIDTLPAGNRRNSMQIDIESGSMQDSIYRGIEARINGTAGNNRAIQGGAIGFSSQENTGIAGFALNGFYNSGVRGIASANPNATGENYGVRGYATQARENIGVEGFSDFLNTNTNGYNYGVIALARFSKFSNIALGAYAMGGNDTIGQNYAVSARATSNTRGENYGIYAEASNGGANFAGFFNGNVTVTGTFSNPSDMKLKSNIKELNNALPVIRQLKPVEYEYKKEFTEKGLNLPQTHQYGFIAQEIQPVLPELITTHKLNLAATGGSTVNNETNAGTIQPSAGSLEFIGVNYLAIIPILVQGIKEQDTKITQLEKSIAELKAQVEELKQKQETH
ncbi:MAG: tail fiber domain-containing protein [Bacteroidota bacterium]|jgi:hypothetical protein